MTYQVAGPSRSRSMAWVDLLMVPNPAAWLEQRLGLLAFCQPAYAKPSAPSPPANSYGERLAPGAMFALAPAAAPIVGLWTVQRPGIAPLALTEAPAGTVSVLSSKPAQLAITNLMTSDAKY